MFHSLISTPPEPKKKRPPPSPQGRASATGNLPSYYQYGTAPASPSSSVTRTASYQGTPPRLLGVAARQAPPPLVVVGQQKADKDLPVAVLVKDDGDSDLESLTHSNRRNSSSSQLLASQQQRRPPKRSSSNASGKGAKSAMSSKGKTAGSGKASTKKKSGAASSSSKSVSSSASSSSGKKTSFKAEDPENVASEIDALLPGAGDRRANFQNARLSIRESRRFDPLSVRLMDVVRVYWYLGLIAFGGPSAHVAILRDHLVVHHEWIEEEVFMELFALGQGLPGPSSTQLVISTAVTHAGPLGGMIAYFFWALPGFIVLTLSGLFLYELIDPAHPPIWLIGVPPAAVSLIFKAFYGFGLTLDKLGVALAMVACAVAVMINGDEHIEPTSSQIVYPSLLFLGGLATYLDFALNPTPLGDYPQRASGKDDEGPNAQERRLGHKIGIPIWAGVVTFFVWLFLLVSSTTLVNTGKVGEDSYIAIFEVFYRIGSIIFGGGVVALPMLENEVVPRGWLTDEQFFQGLGIAQSLPGPLFNFAAFLGATYKGVWGAVVAELGLFGPGYILIFALIPFWTQLRHQRWFKAVLKGVNASAIGLIGSGCVFLYAKSVSTAADAMVFVLAGGMGAFYGVGAPFVIFTGAILGALFSPAVLNVGQVKYH